MTEAEEWKLASELLAEHGAQIGNFLIARANECFSRQALEEAEWWVTLIPKIEALMGLAPPGNGPIKPS